MEWPDFTLRRWSAAVRQVRCTPGGKETRPENLLLLFLGLFGRNGFRGLLLGLGGGDGGDGGLGELDPAIVVDLDDDGAFLDGVNRAWTPPIVMTLSPFLTASIIFFASFCFLFWGRMMRK